MCDHAHRLATIYNDLDSAILTYIEVIREDVSHVRALANLGALYHKKGELSNARVVYLRALQEEPYRSKTTYNLGRLEHESGHYDAARDMYERALLLECDDITRSNSLAYLGLLQQEVFRDSEKAMHCYDHCLARCPGHLRTLDFKCALLVLLGRLEEAAALHRLVCSLDPDHMLPSPQHTYTHAILHTFTRPAPLPADTALSAAHVPRTRPTLRFLRSAVGLTAGGARLYGRPEDLKGSGSDS